MKIIEWIFTALAMVWVVAICCGPFFAWGTGASNWAHKRGLPKYQAHLCAAALPLAAFCVVYWAFPDFASGLLFGRFTLPMVISAAVAGSGWHSRSWKEPEQPASWGDDGDEDGD